MTFVVPDVSLHTACDALSQAVLLIEELLEAGSSLTV